MNSPVPPRSSATPPPPPAPISGGRSKPASTIEQMVRDAHARQASDIHIRVNEVPRFRIRGQMLPFKEHPPVTTALFEQFLAEVLTPQQRKRFEDEKELDTAIFYPGFLRCRVNCFESLNGGAIVLRLISLEVPSIDGLGLPQVMKQLVGHPQGLVLITGPTGSGKSTSLAAMIRHLNDTMTRHVVTIEDPIEYVHSSNRCLVSQREVGLHTLEFHQALRAVLREDPDVILIGEMRDRITVDTALKAAQTGHLVLATLHTRNAINALNRLLNIYHPEEQHAMRIQITESLLAVLAQQLVSTTDGRRTAVHEVLINTPAMADYLLKGQETDAFQLMETDTGNGMQIMNQALCDLVLLGKISPDDAVQASSDPGDLRRRVRNEGYDPSRSTNREFDPSGGPTRDYHPV
ncbi:PilT/PilU family type 4a pilus ATPase [Leptolyngbya sp. FACHB-36]|uniref:type IV pilus twitching motility protein PilT n=1 Tax=Leptolyngbya sp. FACHB-36 TaxID=2692808 RepID=UPI0016814597|nr:PilT/PilU family type 4a pilus ATPase [Leptolyngbya sp. FACHB-36]MBD2021642.1 PilT/PilU family type 4a pilus ATPase [Leptolyngbya sp. FACHB-36]